MQRVRLNNFRASGSILTGLSSVDAPRGRGDNSGTIFTMPAPKNLWLTSKKLPKIFSQLLTTFDFDHEYLRNGSTYQQESLANANVKRATAVHACIKAAIEAQSKIHGRSKHHVSILYAANAILPRPG